jgi:error-prone DNA polymerase
MSAPHYAELHCLSNFSFLRGASHPEELVETAQALGYSALAITDECSLAGAARAHIAARERNLPLVLGAEFALAAPCASGPGDAPRERMRVVALATDRTAYGNLSATITRGRRNSPKGEYRLSPADLAAGLGHCLAILLPDRALLQRARGSAAAEQALREQLAWLKRHFGGAAWLGVELFCEAGDKAQLAQLQSLGRSFGLPCVACGDVHMHVRARRSLQDTLTAIRLKCTLADAGYRLFPNGERHLRTRERLARIYPPELLAETLKIAERCRFSLASLRYEYPEEVLDPGETPTSQLRKLTAAGFERRFGVPLQAAGAGMPAASSAIAKVRAQVERELALIAELEYEPYFLTVHDIVRFARSKDILCQGRGSAANSAVCYCLHITEVDPLKHTNLLFERFISRERKEPPDIDVDFEHQRREQVMQYVYDKYGRDRAALAATLITYRRRSAVRDVGKALGMELAQVDRLAKSLAWWDSREGLVARIREAGFDPCSPTIARLVELVHTLLGFPRHLSQHVGGFVISRGPLDRMVPIENAAMAAAP